MICFVSPFPDQKLYVISADQPAADTVPNHYNLDAATLNVFPCSKSPYSSPRFSQV